MNRLARLQELRFHPMIGKDFKRLTKPQIEEVEKFVRENEHLSDDDFIIKANRFKIDQPKGKEYPIQWGLITQSVATRCNR